MLSPSSQRDNDIAAYRSHFREGGFALWKWWGHLQYRIDNLQYWKQQHLCFTTEEEMDIISKLPTDIGRLIFDMLFKS
jgi:hypothetical protein